jgi:hypothetical protein
MIENLKFEVIQLGDGYSLHLDWTTPPDWYYAHVFYCDPTDGKLVRVAVGSVKKHQWLTVRWARRRKRIHQRALRLAAKERRSRE